MLRAGMKFEINIGSIFWLEIQRVLPLLLCWRSESRIGRQLACSSTTAWPFPGF